MDVNWDLYKVFYFVCEFKNLTKVANYFYVTQPAITKKIKNLENQLGRVLIISNNKGIKITDDGMKLYEELKPAFEAFNKIEADFGLGSEDSKIKIKITAGYRTIDKVLIPAINRFNRKYPNVKFEMATCVYDEALSKLKSGDIDLMFSHWENLKEESDNISVKECYKIQDGFIISGKVKNEFPEKISIYDLNKYPLIVKDSSSKSRALLDSLLMEKGIELKPKYEVTTFWTIENYIKNNKGIGFFVLDYIKDELKDGTLLQIPTFEDIPKRTMYAAYLKNSLNKNIISEFINFIKEMNL